MRRTAEKTIIILIVITALVFLSGCLAPPQADDGVGDSDAIVIEPGGELGEIDGYRYDSPIDVNVTDGVNATERRAMVARSMARVEHLRGLAFEEPVRVNVISREEYRSQVDRSTSEEHGIWRNQIWRALFHVDEHTEVEDELEALYGDSVLGYYSPSEKTIVIVSDDPERVAIDRLTLAHELLHALQDQHFGLGPYPTTLDAQLGRQGLIEGDAVYVEQRYEDRCVSGEWECTDRAPRPRSDRTVNEGMLLTVFHPYSDGPAFVHALRDRNGWQSVDEAYDDHPKSAMHVIYPDRYPDDPPIEVSVPDRSSDEWSRFTDMKDRSDPGETVGEATLYLTFRQTGVIDRGHLFTEDDPRSRYNYSHPITDGWRGDRLVPYHNDGEYAYVFETAWETIDDAEAFQEAYAELLVNRGAVEAGDQTFHIPRNESYAGVYRMERDEATVTIVHAPIEDDLEAVHPAADTGSPAVSPARNTAAPAITTRSGLA